VIDPKLFTVERLLRAMLDDMSGGIDVWRQNATIMTDWMPPFPTEKTRPLRCVVVYIDSNGSSYLNHSKGPRQGYYWDIGPDEMMRPEIALLALLRAPIPPKLVAKEAWDEARRARAVRGYDY
jgi:hypothetical protein